jgi:hypothetical protein
MHVYVPLKIACVVSTKFKALWAAPPDNHHDKHSYPIELRFVLLIMQRKYAKLWEVVLSGFFHVRGMWRERY